MAGHVGNCLLSWSIPKQNVVTATGQDAESFLLLPGRHPRDKKVKSVYIFSIFKILLMLLCLILCHCQHVEMIN